MCIAPLPPLLPAAAWGGIPVWSADAPPPRRCRRWAAGRCALAAARGSSLPRGPARWPGAAGIRLACSRRRRRSLFAAAAQTHHAGATSRTGSRRTLRQVVGLEWGRWGTPPPPPPFFFYCFLVLFISLPRPAPPVPLPPDWHPSREAADDMADLKGGKLRPRVSPPPVATADGWGGQAGRHGEPAREGDAPCGRPMGRP